MNKSQLSNIIRECIQEVLSEEDAGRRVCAWCRKDLGAVRDGKPGDSHGVCPDCLEKLIKDVPSKKEAPVGS